ncbi:MAG: hypothetical protein EBS84_21180 [Proteobacteria bacterium]|nr:hypothetical protein [Verrucomicrobiota bacterium]NBU11487.1 hypothetical protein [Pseudomonadota bacterium]NDE96861.1 hypothetical protein [Verrucomicrobiota bacterium]
MTEKELDTQTIGIDSITPHPKNVRQGDIGAISESLKAHGQYRAIVVQRSTGHILAGNHTWKAAKALGWKKISAHFIDCDDEQAMRILLADNRANDLASYDDSSLLAVLQELATTAASLEGTLYSTDDIDDIGKRIITPLNIDLSDAFGSLPTGDRADATQMTFTLTLDQAEQVREAIAAAKKKHDFTDSDNNNSNGNALWAICDEWQRSVG